MEKIIYLARKLKSFSFDDIFLLAETPKEELKNILDELVEKGQLKRLSTGYVYLEKTSVVSVKTKTTNKKCYNYGIFISSNTQIENLSFCATVNKFLEEYVVKFCTFNTVRSYKSLFKMNIVPYFKDKKIENIDEDDIKNFYFYCQDKNIFLKYNSNILLISRYSL